MMDLLKPPTDNLYKFGAIAGLVLVVAGLIYAPWLFYRSTLEELKYDQLNKELEVHQRLADERRKTLNERKNTVQAELINLQKLTQPNVSGEGDKLGTAITEKRKTVETLEDALHELDLNLALKNAQVKSQYTMSINESRNARFVLVMGSIILVIGVIVTIVGFIMWYRRQQVHQDQVLKMESQARINSLHQPQPMLKKSLRSFKPQGGE